MFKGMKKGQILALGLLLSIVLPSDMFAATGDLPGVVVVFGNVITSIITKVIVSLVILIMLIVAAWEMKENGNARPLKWAIFASMVIGSATLFGDSIVAYMNTMFSSIGADGILAS